MRVVYFIYYLKELDYTKISSFQQYLKNEYHIGKLVQWIKILFNSLKYNISILEYYQFRFFEKSHREKLCWAGTGHMYEYQKIMNPSHTRIILDDKRRFYQFYREFFLHNVFSLIELKNNFDLIGDLFVNDKLVFKISNGKCGTSVKIVETSSLVRDDLLDYMESNGFDMVETFIDQHDSLKKLSPSAVNTVRIFTQLSNGIVEIIGCRLRISIGKHIDNMAAGNVAAPIDESSGIICGPGVYSDIEKSPINIHPITKNEILGFQVPFWSECKELAIKAALLHPENKSIGWDIVVTNNGPGLIEGNHDWCKLVWQLPVAMGLKHLLKIQ